MTRIRAQYNRAMAKIDIQELSDQPEELIDRVRSGEGIIITRDGEDVAELGPVRKGLSAEEVVERHRNLPPMDPESLRRDIDEIFAPGL